MADFTSNFWSILIAGVTLISIAVLIYFVKALSKLQKQMLRLLTSSQTKCKVCTN